MLQIPDLLDKISQKYYNLVDYIFTYPGEKMMLHQKKIALFISHIYGVYQHNLSQGVINQASKYGYKVEIYTTSDGEDLGDYALGEASIIKAPNWQDLEGVIFASSTYTDIELRDQICEHLKKLNDCPVIEITDQSPSFPNIVFENNLPTGMLVSHMIEEHHARHICYLGCQVQQHISDRRKKLFTDKLDEYGVGYTKEYMYDTNEEPDDYKAALQQFLDATGGQLDAVICYNDRLAIGFHNAATQMGYRIPDDFALTGCDYSDEGKAIMPPLTTVTYPTYELGVAAVDAFFATLQGKSEYQDIVIAEPVYSGSCGCKNYEFNSTTSVFTNLQTQKIADIEHSIFESMHMLSAFSHVVDIDDGMDQLEKHIHKIPHCSEFYVCLYSDWDSLSEYIMELTDQTDDDTESSDTMLLKLAYKNGHRLPECRFKKTSLLPNYLENDSDAAYVISPLFFENRSFGYVAMAFENNVLDYPFKLVSFVMNITQLLANLCDSKRTKVLTEHLESIYLKDVLTGLYNHHGFDNQRDLLLQHQKEYKYIHAIIFDLDLLKTINDNFGHEAGDFALKAIGHAMRNGAKENYICARFSGDEFFCLIPSMQEDEADIFAKRVEAYLDHFNHQSLEPFNVCSSYGSASIAISDRDPIQASDIEKLFALADKKMYEYKKNKVKHVLR